MIRARGARSARAPLTCLLTIFATSFRHFSTWLAGMPGGGGGSCIGILPLLHGDAAATAQRRRSRMGVAMVPENSLLAGTAESSPWGAFNVIPRPFRYPWCAVRPRRFDQKMPFLRANLFGRGYPAGRLFCTLPDGITVGLLKKV
jgi:hypothetical protein